MRKWKLILPALEEADTKYWRSIKYSLFPPLGLATLAAYIPSNDHIELVDGHVEFVDLNDDPDIVIIQVYITNANLSYKIADHYRSRRKLVVLGGLHVTSLPSEARLHADAIVIGPGDHIFETVVNDIVKNTLKPEYSAVTRDITNIPPPRRDLIKKSRYFVPNAIVVSRGCPYSCGFCYKHSFYRGGKSYYTTTIDNAISEIDSLEGRHLFFLDDNILSKSEFTVDLFKELQNRNRLIQGAGTISGILDKRIMSEAAKAGLKSLFVGFESINQANLASSNKRHNKFNEYKLAIETLHDYGIKINGSFVFGMDEDDQDVFRRTVDWAIEQGITTATFHIQTPYPGTDLFENLERENRITSKNWDHYTTRKAVFEPRNMSAAQLEEGYKWSYNEFYKLSSILRNAMTHKSTMAKLTNFSYSFGWKKMEPVWEVIVQAKKLQYSMPFFEQILRKN